VDHSERFAHLATVGDLALARICAARIEAEGIDVRLRSESLGPYPVTVGQLAAAEIWVPQGRLEEAGRVMLEAEVDLHLGAVQSDPPAGPVPAYRLVALALAVALMLAVLTALRVL
jgi:hypothetical protein